MCMKRTFALALIALASGAIASSAQTSGGPGNAPPTANVNVVNTPLPVTVNAPVQVSINSALAVTRSDNAMRFWNARLDTTRVGGDTIIPRDSVLPGETFIVSYANVVGGSNISGSPITSAGCRLWLQTTDETGSPVSLNFGALPMHIDQGGASNSDAMYLPLSEGEGLALECVSNMSSLQSTWRASFSGYFMRLP